MAPIQNMMVATTLTLTLTLTLLVWCACAEDDDVSALLDFKKSLSNDSAINNWDSEVEPCDVNGTSHWVGVLCIKGSVQVQGLRLEAMGLRGLIDVDSLATLPALRSISFMNNTFDGPFPDVAKLTKLRALFLSYNNFSGEIPDAAFKGMPLLRKVYLARNAFLGNIPASLATLPKLTELDLEGNQFSGTIPNFAKRKWTFLDLSNNQLEGSVPSGLSDEDPSELAGNSDLCGGRLSPCKSSKKKLIIILLLVAGLGIVLAIILAAFFCLRNKDIPKHTTPAQIPLTQAQPQPQAHTYKNSEHGKLVFVRDGDDRERFELQDLLRASAEVLGSGSFGSSYKAALENGTAVVVKRFRQMSDVGRQEFHEYMTKIGSLSHPNLLPLVAFYYRKEEKLLVSDFVQNASLATHLHGKRGPGEAGLDWPTRLKIIKGVARGLSYLYVELPQLTLPHGHLKSSNVLLDSEYEAVLTDYALMPVVNKEHARECMVAYKSPEGSSGGMTTRKTDVWSLGILILELLTGKFPANYLKQGKADLAAWVNSVVREEWTGEVFDKDMKGTRNCEGQMLKLLKIGMCCCEWSDDRRWDLREAVHKIADLNDKDADGDDFSNSFASDADVYSSRALTDDDFSFSRQYVES